MTIKKALQTIKGYCEKHINCEKCLLRNAKNYCLFESQDAIPYDWDVDEMLKRQRGDSDEVN